MVVKEYAITKLICNVVENMIQNYLKYYNKSVEKISVYVVFWMLDQEL